MGMSTQLRLPSSRKAIGAVELFYEVLSFPGCIAEGQHLFNAKYIGYCYMGDARWSVIGEHCCFEIHRTEKGPL